MSFLPFPTKLIGEYVETEGALRVAVVFYGLTLLALVSSITLLMRYAFARRELVAQHVDDDTITSAGTFRPSYVIYAVAIAIGLVYPFVAVALYFGAALYLGVPAQTIRTLARRR